MAKVGGNVRRIPVNIYNREYLVRTDESVQHINELAHLLDEEMRRISGGNPNIMEVKVAVLAALTVLDKHVKLKKKHEELLSYVTSPDPRTDQENEGDPSREGGPADHDDRQEVLTGLD